METIVRAFEIDYTIGIKGFFVKTFFLNLSQATMPQKGPYQDCCPVNVGSYVSLVC